MIEADKFGIDEEIDRGEGGSEALEDADDTERAGVGERDGVR